MPRLICPTGKSSEIVSSPFRKNNSLRDLLDTALLIPPSRLAERGVSRSSRTWSAGCDGRCRCVRRTQRERTAKSCGLDASTLAFNLAMKLALHAGDGGNKARSPERARSKPLKPLRRECRMFGVPVVTNACAFYLYTRGCGCVSCTGIPCALCFLRDMLPA
jgi:hypothetical protein